MDRFKTNQGISEIHPITERNIEIYLGRKEPYYQKKADGSCSYFAVCPACENPIQIIGIFRDSPEAGRKLYGRHFGRSVPRLADYNEADYLDCPYSNKNWSPGQKRHPNSRVETEFLALLKREFDRVIYILEKDLDLRISVETAQEMLQDYLANRGWTYRDSTLNNLPWKFGQSQRAFRLFGRKIKVNSDLAQVLQQNCPEVELVKTKNPNFVQVQAAQHSFVDLRYFLHSHHISVDGNHLNEEIMFRVYRGDNPVEAVFEKKIDIRTEYFMHLLSLPKISSKRNQNFLRIANELIP